MIYHNLFPRLIGEFHYDFRYQFKETFLQNALKHYDENGRTGEFSGNVDVHLNPELQDIFTFVGESARTYLSALSLRNELFDLNMVKCWFNAIKEEHIPVHKHADAHLSFVYYVQVPDNIDKPIVFTNERPPNELFFGMFGSVSPNVHQWNYYNSQTWVARPIEGQLYIYPSDLLHYTNGDGSGNNDEPIRSVNDLENRRISIAGDFILTYKDKAAKSTGIQPISNWKVY